MAEHTGWLLDVYTHPQDGLIVWLLDDNGTRRRLRQPFPVTFYAAGPPARLRALWRFLKEQPLAVKLSRTERRDLFSPDPFPLLAVRVEDPAAQPRLFSRAAAAFPELTYYNADIPISLRYAAIYGTFPLARCAVVTGDGDTIQSITCLNSPWELDPPTPPLRILALEPDVDPSHACPSHLHISDRHYSYRLALDPARPLLVNLNAILQRHDPDLLLTSWGDTWLLPHLLELSQQHKIPLALNRETGLGFSHRKERSYFTYGQIIYRGQQIHIFGRWHIDGHNAMLFHDYGMEGIFELARVSSLPIQTVARVSPGSGISAMQMLTAMRQSILIPWHKQQSERSKTALELMHADQGGLVYQPIIGLHQHVAEVDFISMYPSVMVRFNISPETVHPSAPSGESGSTVELIPELALYVEQASPGLVPQTLAPLLQKRLALKARMAELPSWHPRRSSYKAYASAHKWLLVTCFGYLGYKNARFGRIEAHEAVTAFGREALLRAKEAAEDLGFTVLHMYVDGLWVKQDGLSHPPDFQPLLDEIAARTGLPIALEGIYRWVAFLPSRQDERVPVANRYFGAFQDGSLKIRGIEIRRRDTPLFIAETQQQMLACLAQAQNAGELERYLPQVFSLLRRVLSDLRAGKVPLPSLLVSQKLSRTLPEYRSPSPAARAAAQLQDIEKIMKPGQCVRFIYTLGDPGVHAWDAAEPPVPASVDVRRYTTLLVRAASTVLQPFGISETALRNRLFDNVVAVPELWSARLPLSNYHPQSIHAAIARSSGNQAVV
jgi:DNA polymerase-2